MLRLLKPHLHGVILIPPYKAAQSDLSSALHKAAGKVKRAPATLKTDLQASKQDDALATYKPITDGLGFWGYLSKSTKLTQNMFDMKNDRNIPLIYINPVMREQIKEFHENNRVNKR